MFIKFYNNGKELIMEIDAISIEDFDKVMRRVKKNWVKQFIFKKKDKNGDDYYEVRVGKGMDKIKFPKGFDYEEVVKSVVDDYELYNSIPEEELRKKFLEEGLVCKVKRIENNHYQL